MSHNINEGRIFYYGEVPWHGIGVQLNKPATAKEAIQAARLDYQVIKEPIRTINSGLMVPDTQATIRTDTNQVLGVVSTKYRIVQNTEAFDFFDDIVGQGQAIYHTAGALGLGERMWILAKLPQNLVVAQNDEVEKFLCLTNSHDGTSCLRMYFTPIRVVCQNTLTLSLKNKEDGIAIRHTGNIKGRVEEARRLLGLAITFYDDFAKTTEALVQQKMDKKEVEAYFDRVLKIEGLQDDDVSTQLKNRRNDLLVLFENGKGNNNPAVRHTAWTAYNAVVEYADYYRVAKNQKTDPTNRLRAVWFGSGATLKNRAFQEIQAILN